MSAAWRPPQGRVGLANSPALDPGAISGAIRTLAPGLWDFTGGRSGCIIYDDE